MPHPSRAAETGYIDPTTIIDEGAHIGAGTTIWHFCHIMHDAVIGEQCHLGQNVVVQPDVRLGDRCRVLNNVTLFTGVHCEEEVFLGPSCVFTNVINPRAAISRKDEFRPTHIGRGASIGANATILCGVKIGAYAMIGAGTVVIRDVAPYALVVGNPARQIGWVSQEGHKLDFSEGPSCYVAEEQRTYHLSPDDNLVTTNNRYMNMESKATTLTKQYIIEPKHSATEMGSGDMPVLATPALIAFMENAAMLLARNYTEEGSTTVGTMITTDHQHATPIGETITVSAQLSSIEGRKLTFAIEATDQAGVVAQATHERFIVSRQRFLERLGIKE